MLRQALGPLEGFAAHGAAIIGAPWRPRPEPKDAEASLAERLLAGDKRALARGITLVENDDPAGWELVREVYPHTGSGAHHRLHRAARRRQEHADRRARQARARRASARSACCRSTRRARSPRARCSATASGSPSTSSTRASTSARWRAAGALGGLSEATLQAVLLMDAAGKEDVFIETVGVGQAEIDIIDHADTIVLALMPGSGRLGAGAEGGRDGDPRRDRRQQGQPSAHRHAWCARSAACWRSAPRPTGRSRSCGPRRPRAPAIEELAEAIDAHHAHIAEQGTLEERRRRNLRNEVLGLAAVRLRRELERSALSSDAGRASCWIRSSKGNSIRPAQQEPS